MKIIEPLKQKEKVADYLTKDVKKIGIVFWHGLGDCVQFKCLYEYIKNTYTDIHFDIMIQNGLNQEVIYPEAILLNDIKDLDKMTDYDYIFLIHFPVETDPNVTKTELSARDEFGLNITSSYSNIPEYQSPLVGIHFQNTALPDVFNPSENIAKKIWQEVLDAELIPIELAFEHPYHNPVNKQFNCVDRTVRKTKATIPNLLGLIDNCKAVIAVPSGPLHCAISLIPKRVFYLEKEIPISRFTHLEIPSVNIKDDKFKEGKIKQWLLNLHI